MTGQDVITMEPVIETHARRNWRLDVALAGAGLWCAITLALALAAVITAGSPAALLWAALGLLAVVTLAREVTL